MRLKTRLPVIPEDDDFLHCVRLASVWAKAIKRAAEVWKTTLPRYFRQRVNKDWGDGARFP